MPVYLPPISRRRFLGQSLAAAAALSIGQGCLGPRRKSGEERWALLSDIHIAADPAEKAHNINMTAHLRSVVREVIARRVRPDCVLVNGDLAYNSGQTADYAAVTGLLQPLRENGLPVHLSLGNHDHRGRFWDALREAKTVDRSLAGRQAAILPGAAANWFILDSLEITLQAPGKLGEAQRSWLARELDARPDKPAIIAIHHNPGPGGSALTDAKELLEILRPRKQVKAWIFGHTHRWDLTRDESGIHLINLPPVAYLFDAWRPAGWVSAAVLPDGLNLELRCLDQKHKDHGQVADLKWRA